ncbi:hypothetical protein CKAN_01800600 [Cinnamomum micranthum f. kanehirae]|uniref:Transmembrane protein n=1 Tax=Cinnamomum micranthum f. kanehirae TaxID=337451 RepID=A0A443PDW9_9MAGN|nr:hypothetical protein CKAN_01800600 [Cinnamomum micranthum f. kanehirae]
MGSRTLRNALVELGHILESSKEKMTREEGAVLGTCKSKALGSLAIGACVALGVVWTATHKLSYGNRFISAGGAAAYFGLWTLDRSLNSSLEHILELEGSRMQWALAILIFTKYRNDPWGTQLVNKHFYAEKEFDDSYPDRLLSRWRPRGFFGGNAAQRTQDDNYNDKPNLEPKQFTMSPAEDLIADPLDCIFGTAGSSDEIHHAENVSVLPRRRSRSHKRAH